MVLDRGTPTPFDDITVRSGQAWVSLTSATEGTSNVTVFAPPGRRSGPAATERDDLLGRRSVAIPTPGNHGRRQRPAHYRPDAAIGWLAPGRLARAYEIASGPEAGFAPDGGTSIEVLTNAAGEAPVELVQKQPVAGTNQVQIYILRPPTIGGPIGPCR